MHNLFLVYFVNLYMFRAYLGPSSGGITVCIQQLVLIILFLMTVCCPGWIGSDRQSSKRISSNCCIHMVVPPDDGPRYTWNMYGLPKYTKKMLCIKLVFLYTNIPEEQTPQLHHRKAWNCKFLLFQISFPHLSVLYHFCLITMDSHHSWIGTVRVYWFTHNLIKSLKMGVRTKTSSTNI